MALWGKELALDRDKLPEALRDKKPEELMELLSKMPEFQSQIDADKVKQAELEAKLQTQTAEFDTIKQKLTDIEARQATPPTTPLSEDEPASPWIDPEKFVQDQTKGIANVALTSGIMTAKMYFKQQLSARDLKIFLKYESEVEKGVSTFAPQAQVMPQSWFNMFMFVKGSHEGDIRKAESDDPGFFSETPSRGGHQEEVEDTTKLTAEEEETCKKFHFDPKRYLEQKKQGAILATSKGAYAKFPVPVKGGQ